MQKPPVGAQATQAPLQLLEERVRKLEAQLAALVQPDGSITLSSNRKVEIKVGVNTLVVDGSGIVLRGAGRLELNNSNKVIVVTSTADISASMTVLNSSMVKCSNLLKTDTLQAINVVASNYTPGAGNIW